MAVEYANTKGRPILAGKLYLLNVLAMLVAVAVGTVWQVVSFNQAVKTTALVDLKEFVSAIDANIVRAAWQINNDTMSVLLQSINRQPGVAYAHFQDYSMDVSIENPGLQDLGAPVCSAMLDYDYAQRTIQNQTLGSGKLSVCFNYALVELDSTLTAFKRQIPMLLIVVFFAGVLSATFYRLVIRPLHNLSLHLHNGDPVETFLRTKPRFFDQPDEIDTLIYELKERTKKLSQERAIVDVSIPEAQDIIAQTDASFLVVRHNQGLLNIVGDAEGDIYLSDYFDCDLSAIEGLQEVVCPHGRRYEIRSVRFRDTEEGGYLFILRDLTEAHERQQTAIRESKMAAIGVLASGVAHDFNNILGGILGNAEFLLEEETDISPAGKQKLAVIIDHSERGASLSTQLLSFARQKSQNRETFKANEAVINLITLAKPMLGANIRMLANLADTSTVTVDRGLLESALMNLVINARDALSGETHGRISVSTAIENRMGRAYLRITVTDNGCGIPSDVLARVREPFFTTKRRGEGAGLGMAMVYGFAEQSNGFLDISSEEGIGTEVSLLLPSVSRDVVHPPTQAARHIEHKIHETSTALNILVVEDEPSLREIMRLVLEKSGFNPTVAKSLRQVKAAHLQTMKFDLVICDVILEDAMAPAILELFRQAGNESKFAYISGNFPEEVVEALGGVDSIATLDKPFKIGDFINFVSSEVRQREVIVEH